MRPNEITRRSLTDGNRFEQVPGADASLLRGIINYVALAININRSSIIAPRREGDYRATERVRLESGE